VTASLDLMLRQSSPPAAPARRVAPAAVVVSHVADFNRRYPGEPVTLFTRVDIREPLPGFTLRISLPRQLALAGTTASGDQGEASVLLVVGDDQYLRWTVPAAVQPGDRFEYQVHATVGQVRQDRILESEAVVMAGPADDDEDGGEAARTSETAAISVESKGAYLRFLPGIYAEQDEFMARYLMLFESFWGPIEQQIEAIPHYVDPEFTPAQLLPWLATWVDLTLDERWPEEKRRRLLASAVSLYRKRGTRLGLQEYLEIYTGAQVRVTEHGAHNFRLGPAARLGPGVALGTINKPHTFTVTAYLPAEPDEEKLTPDERGRLETQRRRMLEAIIEAEKPAHTSYTLRLETL
jgi:phage tail-like protein